MFIICNIYTKEQKAQILSSERAAGWTDLPKTMDMDAQFCMAF